jgi:transcriptional regulator GlxA family with amidase domain
VSEARPAVSARRLAIPAALLSCILTAGCAVATRRGPDEPAAPPTAAGPAASEADATLLALPENRPLIAGFVVVDGVYNTELMAPWDVFQHARYHRGGRPALEVIAISPDGGPVTTAEGLRILPDHGFADAPPIDILVVPSAEGSRDGDLENRALIDFVHRRGAEARFVVSLCWGAFVLAEAGLLDDRACTTFPADYQRFAERFPGARLHINVSFVHDGRFLTSQGGARSYQAALYLLDLLYGEEVAAGVGRGLLIPWPPDPTERPPAITDPGLPRRR